MTDAGMIPVHPEMMKRVMDAQRQDGDRFVKLNADGADDPVIDPFEAERQRLVEWAEGRVCERCSGPCPMLEQCVWTREQIAEYVARPIPFYMTEMSTYRRSWIGRKIPAVTLGLSDPSIPHAYWKWKPYAQRSAEHRADYDRLLKSIRREGVQKPVIACRHPVTGSFCILIGQRRVEIAIRLGIKRVRALVITEDVRRYWKHDVDRIKRHLVATAGEWSY